MRRLIEIAVLILIVAFSAACGDLYQMQLPEETDEWEGETSTVRVEIQSLSRIGNLLTMSTKGENDTASMWCEFIFASATIPNGYIEVLNAGGRNPQSCAADAANPEKCIECASSATAGGCNLMCYGTVPSNAMAGAELIDVDVAFTSSFTSDLAQINVGAVRLEAEVSDTWPTAEFLGNLPTKDFTLCNASEEEFGVNDAGANPDDAFDDDRDGFYESWDYQAYVSSFGPDSNYDGFRSCAIRTTFDIDIPLQGVEVPGASVDLSSFGGMSLTAYVCDDFNNCPAAQ